MHRALDAAGALRGPPASAQSAAKPGARARGKTCAVAFAGGSACAGSRRSDNARARVAAALWISAGSSPMLGMSYRLHGGRGASRDKHGSRSRARSSRCAASSAPGPAQWGAGVRRRAENRPGGAASVTEPATAPLGRQPPARRAGLAASRGAWLRAATRRAARRGRVPWEPSAGRHCASMGGMRVRSGWAALAAVAAAAFAASAAAPRQAAALRPRIAARRPRARPISARAPKPSPRGPQGPRDRGRRLPAPSHPLSVSRALRRSRARAARPSRGRRCSRAAGTA